MAKNTPAATPYQSRRSSISSAGTSTVDGSSFADQNKRPAYTTSSSASSVCSHSDPSYPVDPLSRTFPKPTEEVNVSEMLDRKPLKWTVGHYIKTPTREVSDPFDQAAQDMEIRKAKLLAAKEEMRRLAGQ